MRVEFLESFGGDENHVNVARVSYAKKASEYTEAENEKLIKYLVKHGHDSPFRHSTLQFRIKCPIYVERQLHKHQVGISVNSVSGRYVDFSDSYHHIPNGGWRKQSKSSKQGSEGLVDDQDFCDEVQSDIIERCKKAYQDLLEKGVSKEQARSILPLNLETEFIWTGSFLAFVHMCKLRLKPDAQQETREVVSDMLDQLVSNTDKFNVSLMAFDII